MKWLALRSKSSLIAEIQRLRSKVAYYDQGWGDAVGLCEEITKRNETLKAIIDRKERKIASLERINTDLASGLIREYEPTLPVVNVPWWMAQEIEHMMSLPEVEGEQVRLPTKYIVEVGNRE